MSDLKKQRENNGKITDRPWSSALLLLLSAGYFAVAADLPHVFFFTLSALAAGLFSFAPWRINDRSIIYSVLAALALTVIGNFFWPVRNSRFGFLAFFLRPALSVPFFLYGAALLTGFRRRSLALASASAAAFFTFAAAGDLSGGSIASERIPGLENAALLLRDFYIAALIPVTVAVLYSLRGGRRMITLVLISAIALFCWLEIRLYTIYEQPLRQFENMLLRFGIRQIAAQGSRKIEFSNTAGNLNLPFFQPDAAVGNRIILRASGGNGAPGYLRNHAFSHYRNGSWENPARETPQALEVAEAENPLHADQLFLLPEGTNRTSTFRIYPDSQLSGDPILLPGETGAISMIADSAVIESDGKIKAESFQPSGGYLIWKSPGYQLPGTTAPEEFLEIPAALRWRFTALAQTLKLPDASSDRERIQLLRRFFDSSFTYALDWSGGGGDDPTLAFLEKIRRGHCELFASGAALLLRAAGVPARYVTGVLCMEPLSGGLFYVARLRNVHAWTEYFDRETACWNRFDPTPASALVPQPVPPDFREPLKFRWQELFGAFRRGHLTAAVAEAGFFLLRYCWAPLIAFFLYRCFRRRRLQKGFRLGREQKQIQKEFFALLCRLRKRGIKLPGEPSAEEILPFLSEESERQFVLEYQKRRFMPDVSARR